MDSPGLTLPLNVIDNETIGPDFRKTTGPPPDLVLANTHRLITAGVEITPRRTIGTLDPPTAGQETRPQTPKTNTKNQETQNLDPTHRSNTKNKKFSKTTFHYPYLIYCLIPRNLDHRVSAR